MKEPTSPHFFACPRCKSTSLYESADFEKDWVFECFTCGYAFVEKDWVFECLTCGYVFEKDWVFECLKCGYVFDDTEVLTDGLGDVSKEIEKISGFGTS